MPPEQSSIPQQEHHGKKYLFIAPGLLIIVVGLLAYSSYYQTPEQTSDNPTEQTYRNDTFGFFIELPSSWQGYRVNHIKEDIRDITGRTTANNGVVGSFQIIELHHPLETADNPREDMPIMIFTPTQWEHIQRQEWSVGAAPIPPSLLGQNSEWVMALPARYNYDYKPGWEEVDELVHTLQTFEPGTGESRNINSFASCKDAGYPIMESYPERCRTPEGLTFVNYEMCIQVIAEARNPNTGETRTFPTPCDVPEGWEKI